MARVFTSRPYAYPLSAFAYSRKRLYVESRYLLDEYCSFSVLIVRLMKAQSLIINAQDATEARTRTFLHDYLDGLSDKGHLSVYNAQSLKAVATIYCDRRLDALETGTVSEQSQVMLTVALALLKGKPRYADQVIGRGLSRSRIMVCRKVP